ncbi:hypothetical protein PUR47_31160, partial [Klebsiella pneumoniae]|uniref:hypothetical protein n=1 Tax=Klebsiella pneumoniae TaxID=573 RepID=UPI0023F6EED3|nr:hypothetical protein [Klebsiella pneumoniae]
MQKKFANRRPPAACARSALILDAGWQTRASDANYYRFTVWPACRPLFPAKDAGSCAAKETS